MLLVSSESCVSHGVDWVDQGGGGGPLTNDPSRWFSDSRCWSIKELPVGVRVCVCVSE